jgi:hypothetical protein
VSAKVFFFPLYTALLNVAKKKRNFDIGEEHKRRNKRQEGTKEKKNHDKKKTKKKRWRKKP